ncbi:helix-turn-helix domain-containing protein [Streptomyces cavernicola]|uniref:Helix-turn-helix transcriptional regulator n=1 Tax=Streptomyces cavernicola TaxID=3043613 RepID=A0ABT6S4S0_9ACTN|nr:helix-turn-helix transcriptional regulator [Streptomyces sp. B-S-A6]MDI3402296.1 helix-turn-helix transcriptional regulator [Streptomyces sp. B-S-A6]
MDTSSTTAQGQTSEGRDAQVIPLRPAHTAPSTPAKEPLWRDVVGDVLRRERLVQERTLKDVAEAARISMPYLSELERGRKEASSEVLAAAARALGLSLTDLLSRGHAEVIRLSGAGPVSSGAGGRSGPRVTDPTVRAHQSHMRLAA